MLDDFSTELKRLGGAFLILEPPQERPIARFAASNKQRDELVELEFASNSARQVRG
jgi:hypothetical protein